MILIIYCHPYEQSFNHAELKAIKENLSAGQWEYEIIDLYAEHFNLVYSTEELQLYHRGETTDPLVTKYLKLCQQADTVILLHLTGGIVFLGCWRASLIRWWRKGWDYHIRLLKQEWRVSWPMLSIVMCLPLRLLRHGIFGSFWVMLSRKFLLIKLCVS